MRSISGDHYYCLGPAASPVFWSCYLLGCLMPLLDVIVMHFSEKQNLLGCLYYLFPSRETTQDKLKLSKDNYNLLRNAFKYGVLVQDSIQWLMTIPLNIMVTVLSGISVYKEDSLIFGLCSLPNLLLDWIIIEVACDGLINGQLFTLLSGSYGFILTKQIKESDSLNVQEIHELFLKMQRINRQMKHHLNNCMVVFSPLISLMIFLLVIEMPVWVVVIMGLAITNLLSMILFALYFCGSLHVMSASLTSRLYSGLGSEPKKSELEGKTGSLTNQPKDNETGGLKQESLY